MRRYLLLLLGLLLLSWSLPFALSLFQVPIVFNSRPTSFLVLLFVWVLTPFLLVLFSFSPWSIVSVALLTSGANSNLLWRLFFGPVPDYIPLPGDIYANLADLFLLFGGSAYLFLLLRTLWRTWRPLPL